MRCKRDYYSRSGKSRYAAMRVVELLERAKTPQTKEQLIASLGGGTDALGLFRTAVAEGMIEPLPGGLYKAVLVRPPPLDWEAMQKTGHGPRIAPAHATHVRRHRPGIRKRK